MISGSATTFEAFCLGIQERDMPIEVAVLVADRTSANLGLAERMNRMLGWSIRPVLLDKATYSDGATERTWDMTDAQSEALLAIAQAEEIDLFTQQGWLSRTRGVFHEAYGEQSQHDLAIQSRLLNNHPGIPEDTPGLWGHGVHERAAELRKTAFTVHAVSDGYDEGIVYASVPVPVLETDTAHEIERSVQAAEKVFTPGIILRFLDERRDYLALS
jgi:folate-dependent phosphoribosylglycinamide formyltransferase PurN